MLKNKVAVVTGGTRGIGLEIVRVFKENGAEVILFGSRQDTVDKAITQLKEEGMEVTGYCPNLGSFDEVEKTVGEIISKYGRIDILVNNAGISANKKIEDTTAEEFDNIMNLNVKAIFNAVKAVVPNMKENGGGVILNTSSMVSIYGQPSGVTKSLARELAPFQIRVNAVAPGITKTDMVAALPEAMIQPLIKTIPLGRIGEPRDVANVFLFLASDLASYVTGDILSVDGCARA